MLTVVSTNPRGKRPSWISLYQSEISTQNRLTNLSKKASVIISDLKNSRTNLNAKVVDKGSLLRKVSNLQLYLLFLLYSSIDLN